KDRKIDAYFYMDGDKPYIEIEGADVTKKSPVLQAVQGALQSYQKTRAEDKKADTEDMKEELKPVLKKVQQQTGESLDVDFPDMDISMKEPEVHYLYNDKDADLFDQVRSEEHTSELQSRFDLVCRLLLEKKK